MEYLKVALNVALVRLLESEMELRKLKFFCAHADEQL